MQSPETIVYVVNDDPAEVRCLTKFFSLNGLNVIWFRSAAEYMAAALRDDRIACLILDLNAPDISGQDVQSEITASEGPPIIFLATHDDIVSAVQAIKNGAIDLLVRPVDYSQLMAALEAAFAHDRRARRERAENLSLLDRWKSLTPREKEVFHYTVAGFLNKQGAADLGIAENTYQVHRGRVMRKMKAGSLADLVRMSTKLDPILKPQRHGELLVYPQGNDLSWAYQVKSSRDRATAA